MYENCLRLQLMKSLSAKAKKVPIQYSSAGLLRTKRGRLINQEEWQKVEKRLLERPVHPSVESFLHFKQVPVAKFRSKDDLQASIERLHALPEDTSLNEERQRPHWVKQELKGGRWHDVEVPWRQIRTPERNRKCVEMHDRAKADKEAKLNHLLEKYCKPLVKQSTNEENYKKRLVQQFCGRPHLSSHSR